MFDYMKFKMGCLYAGKTEADVAREIGISRAAITGWKKGSQPSAANLKKLAEYFGEDISSFEKNDGEEYEVDEKNKVVRIGVDDNEQDCDIEYFSERLHKSPGLRMLLSATDRFSEEDYSFLVQMAQHMNRE